MPELLKHIVEGLLGGLVLNVMPCVLPVLTLKAFHLIDGHRHDAARKRALGFAYLGGTTSFFLAFGVIVAVMRGVLHKQLFYGQQFSSPAFMAAIVALLFAFGLNALGVFEITLSSDGEQGSEDTLGGSVMNGWFAALMATPCSAPMLAGATAYAFAKDTSAASTLAIFGSIGVGLSLPYVMLTVIPAASKLIPRPGAWMETFKQVMGFTLIGAALFFFRAYEHMVSDDSAASFLIFLLAMSIGLWAIQKFGSAMEEAPRRWGVRVLAIVSVVLVAKYGLTIEKAALKPTTNIAMADCAAPSDGRQAKSELPPVVKDGHLAWTPYNGDALKKEHKRNRPVFLDFTAEWCANCKTNEKVILETDAVRAAFDKSKVLPMKADMTDENEELSKLLEKLGRAGIPDYVIMYPDDSFDLLPQQPTIDGVVEKLAEASKRYPAEKFAMN